MPIRSPQDLRGWNKLIGCQEHKTAIRANLILKTWQQCIVRPMGWISSMQNLIMFWLDQLIMPNPEQDDRFRAVKRLGLAMIIGAVAFLLFG